MLTATTASLESRTRRTKHGRGSVAWFLLFVLVGSLGVVYPLVLVGCLAVAATLGFCWLVIVHVRRANLESWQVPLLVALTGYMLLNYGFENLTIHVGAFPIIISYGLMYASLALAVSAHQHLIGRALKEPVMQCVLAFLVLSFLHLVVDIPSYGLWAVRDSSMCLDGIFMLLGLLWAMKSNSTIFLTKWLMFVFVLNLMYGFTLPWSERLWSWSPESGVFLHVPVLGNYHGTGDVSTAGALFCLCIAADVVRCPRWMMLCLAMAQLLGVAIAQTRRMYLGIVVAFVILVFLGEAKKYGKLLIILSSAIVVLLLLTVGGIEIPGRIGPVNISFFEEHIRSISGAEGTPGSRVQGRLDWDDQAFQHFLSHPLLGEGFGQPLLTEVDTNNAQGAVTRMPHNSSLSFLARLGVIGFAIWLTFHWCLMKRFIYALRQRRCCDKRLSDLLLWFFLFYVLFMIESFVEAPFEFPSAAIPFYFLMGVALGLIRWHLPQTDRAERRPGSFVGTVQEV